MSVEPACGVSYFGKLPARGDFLRGGNQMQLIGLLDRWTSACMEAFAENPRWKLLFDSAPALDFAFVGAHSRLSVVGHLKPSRDAAGRRFPFIAAAAVERNDPLPFRCGPVGFTALWGILRRVVGQACNAATPIDALGELASLDCAASIEHALKRRPLDTYVRSTTLGQLTASLGAHASPQSVRRQILAIGLLMRPLLGRNTLKVEKGLCLPLPANVCERNRVAALWLFLVTLVLSDTPCELQLLLGRINGQERMLIGFTGASPRPLLSLLSPLSLEEHMIVLDDPEWIERHPDLAVDRGVARLSTYLAQPAITLESALITFKEVFTGS
ncbi:type VI secretion-associated protein [Parazoarcus communis]|uniref:Type VI secretion-associated protein n=1 Tax=Parazoarcus communis TaxID=41977 RepID=A0A2U8GKM0_9RHOO|nr:type VI secretion system-associated protein TagF [Parazoarcus communis]AWI74071.1 type VI secretion-associated protein [Parazoarcus communis]